MGIIAWIILGLIAGALVRMLAPGKEPQSSIIMLALGAVGALLGGFVATEVFHVSGIQAFFDLPTWLYAIFGAAILPAGYHLINSRRSSHRAGLR